MFEEMPQIQTGVLIFVAIAIVLLASFRLTHLHPTIRSKIKIPLFLLSGLVAFFNVFFILGRTIPSRIEPYYFALLYLTFSLLIIRVGSYIFFDFFLIRWRKYHPPRLLKEITSALLLTVVVVVVIQHTLKIQVTTLLATSALISIVLALALQETLGNLFAGLSIHLDPPYRPGEWIRTGDIIGRVDEITWRATKLRTVNNDYVVIPNGQIAKERLINHSYPRLPHASRVTIAVSYDTPPNRMDRVARGALATVHNVVTDPPPEVRLAAFQDFSINYEIKFFLRDYGALEPTLAEIRKALWYHLRRDGIEIPFPIRNIYVHERQETLLQAEQTLNRLSDSLSKVYLFSSLDQDEKRLIAESLIEQRYAKNEIIIREGEQDESFYIIERGDVEVFIISPSGNKKVLSTLNAGDFFGEIALLTGQRRTANVVAVTDVRVYKLEKESFKQILESKPDILDEIGTILCRRKDQLELLIAESSGPLGADLAMNLGEAKSRILSRLRTYFGL